MKHFRKLAGRGLLWAWCLVIALVAFFNVRLYSSSPLAKDNETAPPTLVAQLAANRNALEAGSALRMQQLFPEGY